jgi:hypothetical protein
MVLSQPQSSKTMKLAIEVHKYAPELNKAFFLNNRGEIVACRPAPGIVSIRQFRDKFKPAKPVRCAWVAHSYSDRSLQWLDRVRSGVVQSYADALRVKRDVQAKVLPDAQVAVTCKTRLVWL